MKRIKRLAINYLTHPDGHTWQLFKAACDAAGMDPETILDNLRVY